MALLLAPMSAIPHIQHHMTSAHGHSVPSNLSHNQANAVTQSGGKRPKLSLQTTSLTSTYGSLTRGLPPNTTQTLYTPTTANTLSNTWDLSIRPSPISRTDSPRPLPPTRTQTGQQPYTYSLPFGVKPILKNTPLPPRAASVSASPRETRRKVFFPQPKRVCFKSDLEEIIGTTQYVAKHSDLTSSEEEVSSSDEESQTTPATFVETGNQPPTYHTSPPPNRKRKVRRDSGISIDPKAESSASSSSSTSASTSTESDHTDDTTSTRPRSTCKRRKWRSSSSQTSFGNPIQRTEQEEGLALLRRDPCSSSSSATDTGPSSSTSASTLTPENPATRSSYETVSEIYDRDQPQEQREQQEQEHRQKEDYEVLGSQTEARRASSGSPLGEPHGLPN